jgi:hypothetical protein
MTEDAKTATWELSFDAEVTLAVGPVRKVWRGWIKPRLVYEVPMVVSIGGHEILKKCSRGASFEEAMQKAETLANGSSDRIAAAWDAAEKAFMREIRAVKA